MVDTYSSRFHRHIDSVVAVYFERVFVEDKHSEHSYNSLNLHHSHHLLDYNIAVA